MQFILNGLITGSAIALLALAFQMVYLPTRIFFIGLAGIYSLAPFIALSALQSGWGWFAAMGTAVLVSVTLAVLMEWANHAPLARRNASEGVQLISSLGIYIIVVQIIAMVWGNETKTLRTGLDAVTRWGDVIVVQAQWIMLGVSAILIAGFALFLMHSDLGLRLRALADNQTQFALYGYNVDAHRVLAFAISGGFAAVAALVTAYDIGFDPYVGLHTTILAVVAVIIGGRGSFAGVVLGGLLLGVLRSEVVWHLSARWQEAATFTLLALFLLLRPQGLLGSRSRIEAE